jgi:hypothetical protein
LIIFILEEDILNILVYVDLNIIFLTIINYYKWRADKCMLKEEEEQGMILIKGISFVLVEKVI